jgi:hypothetical protein
MLSRLSIAAAIAATFVFTASAYAEVHNKSQVNRTVNVNRNVTVNKNVTVVRPGNVVRSGSVNRLVVGRSYHGGVWYGTGRRYWRGQWYPYGVGDCWLLAPIGYVWVC